MNDQNDDPIAQLEAMKKIAEILTPLGGDARSYVLEWAAKNYGSTKRTKSTETLTSGAFDAPLPDSTAGIGEFYARANPQSEPEKVAVVSYWLQVREGCQDLDSQRVNRELKHLGHGVMNVTSAFSALMHRKPQLAIQTRKSGNTKQARKRYLLTGEGRKFVEAMLSAIS